MGAGKLANWLESYADAMERNVWLTSTIDSSKTKWDEATKKWHVTVLRTLPNGQVQQRPFAVSHVILATGLAGGKAKMPPPFKGQENWGGTVVHSSRHKGGAAWAGKKALVVGSCTSGHDISVDLVNNGVKTTMLQRSPTFIMSIDKGLPLLGTWHKKNLELHFPDAHRRRPVHRRRARRASQSRRATASRTASRSRWGGCSTSGSCSTSRPTSRKGRSSPG
jgi:cation diffusion facilitator CzcD-associated flavoprotein CzcO